MSRADSTLDEWLDVVGESENKEDDTQDAVSGAQWEPEPPQCECGAAVTEWHSAHEAREMVRVYGSAEDGTVPVCPACVDWSDCSRRDYDESIPHAIREMQATASIERHSRSKLALREVDDA